MIGWRQSKTTGKNLPKEVVLRQFAQANNRLLAGDDPTLDMTNADNDSEMKMYEDQQTVVRTANVYDVLEIWQGR